MTLDGSSSSDPDGTIVSYEWREGATVLGTTTIVTTTLPVGVHTIDLTVTDNNGATRTDTVVITVNPNQAPVANAGADQTVIDSDDNGFEIIVLDGSASSDPDGSITSYEWKEGVVLLETTATASSTFAVGTYTVTLTVIDDGGATSTDTAVITVNPYVNQPPVASAGPDHVLSDNDGTGAETVTLDGSASFDPDGSIVSYEWREGATVLATTPTTTQAFAVGTHTVTLTVIDDKVATASDTALITVNANQAPTTNAGPDQTVTDTDGDGFETMTLNGSGSDADGTTVSYEWREGATVLGATTTLTHSFAVGEHTLTFTVTDNGGAQGLDTALITVNDVPSGPVGEGALFSKNPDFSTEDRDFDVGEILYVKFFSDKLDYTDLNQAEWQIGQAQGDFQNHNNGFYTMEVLLTEQVAEVPSGEADELEFQGVIQDNVGRQLERQVILMVTNTNSPPAGGDSD